MENKHTLIGESVIEVSIRESITDLPRSDHPYGRTVYTVTVNNEDREAFYSKREAEKSARALLAKIEGQA
jgi:hypothetical protein